MLDSSDVRYHVSVDPQRHELRVRMRLTGAVARGTIRLQVPTWVPGDYTFAQIARDLFDVRAHDTRTDKELRVTRYGWQAFGVAGGDGDVTVTWRAFAFEPELGEQAGILDGQYGVLLGARYLHSPAHLGRCTVTYELPEAWQGTIHHPSGAEPGDQPNTWHYPSYEILLDTPVAMGHYRRFEERVRGTPFWFVFLDGGVGFDVEAPRFVKAVAKVAETYHAMFGSFPFADYTFVLSLNPQNAWGLEHLTSTMCGLDPDVFTNPDLFAVGVRVCSHELFHAWNVRRLRPAPLGHVAEHLTTGSFTEGLWMAEGFTRYYEFLSCARTGIYTLDQFVSAIVGYLEHLRVVPAYERVSAVDSSLTTYLNHSPRYPGRTSTCIDYYDKGMLIAFGLDATLRLRTPDQSLDTAFRGFYERHVDGGPEGAGYTTTEVIAYFAGILPTLGAQLEAEVRQPGGLITEALLAELGFVVEREDVRQLGLMFLNNGAPALYDVLDDSPAGRSGIAPQDVITGVNGFGWTASGLAWAARQDAPVTIEVTRGQRRLSFTMTPAPRQRIARVTWGGDTRQAERLAAWLGRPVELSAGHAFALDFYENFHGVESVV